MDIIKFIEENDIPIINIDKNRGYWLVRTQSGENYNEFFHDGFIGIGWNEFIDTDRFISSDRELIISEMKEIYRNDEEINKQHQHGRIYGTISRFISDIKIGDIVMIPSTNSTHITFGIVESDVYIKNISETEIDNGVCDFKKRRNVSWIKTVKRNDLDPYLYKMLQTHHTINNASDYADNIDRTLYSFYLKGDVAHLIIQVKQENEIPALDLINYVNTVLEIVPLIETPLGEMEFGKHDIDLKLNVQSPGIMDFFSSNAYLITIIGLIIIGFVGGRFSFNKTTISEHGDPINNEFIFESDGFMEKAKSFIKTNKELELLKIQQQHANEMEKLKVQISNISIQKNHDH